MVARFLSHGSKSFWCFSTTAMAFGTLVGCLFPQSCGFESFGSSTSWSERSSNWFERKTMCGGSIISDFIPANLSRHLTTRDIWPDFDTFAEYTNNGVVPKSFSKSDSFDKGSLDSNEGYK